MQLEDVSIPDIYKESEDFNFFFQWFVNCLSKIHYDTENFFDLYDPMRCPDWLLWMLADTMGFKYDDRLPTSFNRLVLLYFMSMIRNRGSKDGVTLAAEVNLKQFDIEAVAGTGYVDNHGNFIKPQQILYNRLEDTSIPVNSVYVTCYTDQGYIDVVYFSDTVPTDACIEYVRPLGMYCIQNAGVRMDGRTRICVDGRLTNNNDIGLSIGPTHVGHYSREDYASLQRINNDDVDLTAPVTSDDQISDRQRRAGSIRDGLHQSWNITGAYDPRVERNPVKRLSHSRRNVWYRNPEIEGYAETDKVQGPSDEINPGYRALYSLQLCNNEHIVKSLIPTKPGVDISEDTDLENREHIFGLGWEPQDVSVTYPEDYVLPDEDIQILPSGRIRIGNLRYDRDLEKQYNGEDVWTIEDDRSNGVIHPRPAVNPVMRSVGDAMSVSLDNKKYMVAVDADGNYPISEKDTIDRNGCVTFNVQSGTIANATAEKDGVITPVEEGYTD